MNDDWPPPKSWISLAGKNYCPKCTKILHHRFDSTYAGFSLNPVILVKRINKKTNDWFWGCPNFPKCKYSRNRSKTHREIQIQTWAWANAQEGPHY